MAVQPLVVAARLRLTDGIPAVMGVRGITAALSTEQVVQVDGNRGRAQLVMTLNFTPTG
ncbi:MAG TPA: PEP-utilizing enzyme [Anaerolineae bacterium]|nr:PEP-utilizing enzyme [Anaerolineae bacterium]